MTRYGAVVKGDSQPACMDKAREYASRPMMSISGEPLRLVVRKSPSGVWEGAWETMPSDNN